MNNDYDDIINLPHYQSKTRKPMSLNNRAAQFAPFSALSGYDDAIAEAARLTYSRLNISDDELNELSDRLRQAVIRNPRPEVCITYFKDDSRKSGGRYLSVRGIIKKIEPHYNLLTLKRPVTNKADDDEISLPLDSISDIKVDDGHDNNRPDCINCL